MPLQTPTSSASAVPFGQNDRVVSGAVSFGQNDQVIDEDETTAQPTAPFGKSDSVSPSALLTPFGGGSIGPEINARRPKQASDVSKANSELGDLASRMSGRFTTKMLEGTGLKSLEDLIALGPAALTPRALQATRFQPFTGREPLFEGGVAPITAVAQNLEKVRAQRLKAMGIDKPAETVLEKVAETAGGLGAFIAKLAVLNRAGAVPLRALPAFFRAPVVWEVENQMAGGPTGHGAAMAMGLGALGAVPKQFLRPSLKLGLESVGFGALAAVEGADEVDIYINMAIPGALRGMHGVKKLFADKLRKAETTDEIASVVKEVKAVADKAKVEQGIPEDHQPTVDETFAAIKEFDAQLTREERSLRAEDIKRFRKGQAEKKAIITKNEVVEPPIDSDLPPTSVPGAPIRVFNPFTGKLETEGKAEPPIDPVDVREAVRLKNIEIDALRERLTEDEADPQPIIDEFFKEVYPKLPTKTRAWVDQNVLLKMSTEGSERGVREAFKGIDNFAELERTEAQGIAVLQLMNEKPRAAAAVAQLPQPPQKVSESESSTAPRPTLVEITEAQARELVEDVGWLESVLKKAAEFKAQNLSPSEREWRWLETVSLDTLIYQADYRGVLPKGNITEADRSKLMALIMDPKNNPKDTTKTLEELKAERVAAAPAPSLTPLERADLNRRTRSIASVEAELKASLGRAPTRQEVLREFRPKTLAKLLDAKLSPDNLRKAITRELRSLARRPDIVGVVGAREKLSPVVENDIPKRFRPSKSRPRALSDEEFRDLFEQGLVVISPRAAPDWRSQYEYRIAEGSVTLPEQAPPAGVKITEISTFETVRSTGEHKTFDISENERLESAERAKAANNRADLIDAFNQLPEAQKVIFGSLHPELIGSPRPPLEVDTLAKFMSLTPAEVRQKDKEIILGFRKSIGADAPDATVESVERAHGVPYRGPGERRGMISTDLLLAPFRGIAIPVRLAGRLIQAEARDMIEAVERTGGKVGVNLGAYMRGVADRQQEFLGQFQRKQIMFQRMLNGRLFGVSGAPSRTEQIAANWGVQHDGYKTGPTSNPFGRIGGPNWTMDRLPRLLLGEETYRNPGEEVIDVVLRTAQFDTGSLLERVGLMLTRRSGMILPFSRAPKGFTFLQLTTREYIDALVNGFGHPDKILENAAIGYSEANNIPLAKVKAKLNRIRRDLVSDDPRKGYHQIGPELAKAFRRPVTGVKAANGRHVQLLVTEPRQYLDSLYTSSAIRAGFVEALGQDNKQIDKLRNRYLNAGGNPWAFNNAIRALSDILPDVGISGRIGEKLGVETSSPASGEYGSGKMLNALLNVLKQFNLTGTALIQASETPAIAAFAGVKPVLRAMSDVLRFGPSRKALNQELIRNRILTPDIISYSLNRSVANRDIVNKAATILSRVHLNKFANEILNESLAARAGRLRMLDIIARGQARSNGVFGRPVDPINESDFHWLRLLKYTPAEAMRFAQGYGTSADHYAAMRRATGFMTATTNLMSQRSPLQNTRAYRFMVAFTPFFSNRVRQFANYAKLLDTDARALRAAPSAKAAHRAWTSTYQLAKFAVGVELGGMFATFLYSMLREFSLDDPMFGVRQRAHEAWAEPFEFLGTSFMYGTVGPLYGAVAETVFRSAGMMGEEPTENILQTAARAIYPLNVSMEVLDAIKGTGPYRDTAPVIDFSQALKGDFEGSAERVKKWLNRNVPGLKTTPMLALMDLAGVQVQDLKMTAAVGGYWRWMSDPEHNAIPPKMKSLGSMTDEHRRYRISLRRAIEAQFAGRDPMPHLVEAFAADPADLSSAIRAKKFLDRPELDDDKRTALEAYLGPDSYAMLEEHDTLLEVMAIQADALSKIGGRMKETRTKTQNLIYELTHPKPERR